MILSFDSLLQRVHNLSRLFGLTQMADEFQYQAKNKYDDDVV